MEHIYLKQKCNEAINLPAYVAHKTVRRAATPPPPTNSSLHRRRPLADGAPRRATAACS